jgi:hypothetical protein
MAIRDGLGRWPVSIEVDTVKRYMAEGLTQDQMAERFFNETGERRGRSSFAAVIHRHGLNNPRATPRYEEDLPWKGVKAEHFCYEQRMLRALGARRHGHTNADAVPGGRLDAWLAEMDKENLVVMYEPELGFFKVPREDGDVGYVTVTNLHPK